MNKVLRGLEPRFIQKKTIIINELDEFGEIIFVKNGVVGIGFEINKQQNFCIRFENKCVIGAYGVTFNMRAAFIYKAFTNLSGYFIRKFRWNEMLQSCPEIAKIMKQNVLIDYLINLRSKVIQSKHKIMHKYMQRNDHQTLLVSEPKDKKQTADLCRIELTQEKKEKHILEEKAYLNNH